MPEQDGEAQCHADDSSGGYKVPNGVVVEEETGPYFWGEGLYP